VKGLTHRVREAWDRRAVRGRFRDPFQDFAISSERVTEFNAAPVVAGAGPCVLAGEELKSLHFNATGGDRGSAGVHSVMSRSDPHRLMLSYTEMMMGFTRFIPQPHTLGLIGLGGGSLVKHCYRYLSHTRMIVAENSAEVLALRRDFFIPDDDERLQVLLMDGAEMVRASAGIFDVLMVDAFDAEGYPPHLATREFYRDCRAALTSRGVLVVNFCGEDWRRWFRRLDSVFGGRCVLYQCPDGDNVIAFAGSTVRTKTR
jgi:spermidine synthase